MSLLGSNALYLNILSILNIILDGDPMYEPYFALAFGPEGSIQSITWLASTRTGPRLHFLKRPRFFRTADRPFPRAG